jgi:hypothetical protein
VTWCRWGQTFRFVPGALALALCIWPARGVAFADQVPQVDIPDLIRAIRKQPPPSTNQSPSNTQISFLPTISSNPAIGVAFGAVMSLATRRGGDDSRVSTAQASIAFTSKKQVIGTLRNDFHSQDDAWSLVGDVRLAKFYQRAPQLGTDVDIEAATIDVDYNWIRLYQTAYRKVRGPFHVGLGYHLDSFIDIEPRDGDVLPPPVADRYPLTTIASAVSVDALFDSRDNSLNANRGLFGRASYFNYPTFMGSDREWQSLQLEGRAYVSVPSDRRQVLAVWTQWWQTLDGTPPYFNLPSVGWDTYGRTGRGYPAGRLRGLDWGYAETEYRVDLMRNGLLGAVAFVNASTFSDITGAYGPWATGGGAGLRVKLDKKYGTNLAMDFAWGRDGSRGVWFGLNEAF